MFVERRDTGVLLVRRPIQAAGNFKCHVRIVGFQIQYLADILLGQFRRRHAKVDADDAFARHHIDAGASPDLADVQGDADVVIRHRLDIDDLAGHL